MKLIFLIVATIVLCSVLIEARPPVRRRVIRIRIIRVRVIPIRRRGRRDVSTEAPVSVQAEAPQDVSVPDFGLVGGGAVPNVDALSFTNVDDESLSDVDFDKVRDALRQSLQAHQVEGDADVEVEMEMEFASSSAESSANVPEPHSTVYETVWEPTEVAASA